MSRPASIPERQSRLTDLCPPAIQVARRLQALPDRRVYRFTLIKVGQCWVLEMEDEKGRKAEVCK